MNAQQRTKREHEAKLLLEQSQKDKKRITRLAILAFTIAVIMLLANAGLTFAMVVLAKDMVVKNDKLVTTSGDVVKGRKQSQTHRPYASRIVVMRSTDT